MKVSMAAPQLSNYLRSCTVVVTVMKSVTVTSPLPYEGTSVMLGALAEGSEDSLMG